MSKIDLLLGDCIDQLKTLPENSVDSMLTDPPYGLSKKPDIKEVMEHWIRGDDYLHNSKGFMGSTWDSFVPGPAYWRECYRVLKPGGYGLVFGGTRTYDLLTISLRFAGFRIVDSLHWIYASGFPKSHSVEKALNKLGYTKEAEKFKGYGSQLKPAHEPIVLIQKEISESTIALNVLKHGTGAINIDASRVSTDWNTDPTRRGWQGKSGNGWHENGGEEQIKQPSQLGRFPSNFLLSHSENCVLKGEKKVKSDSHHSYKRNGKEFINGIPSLKDQGNIYASPDGTETVPNYLCDESCPVKLLDEQSGFLKPSGNKNNSEGNAIFSSEIKTRCIPGINSYRHEGGGTASRFFKTFQPEVPFFYSAKTSGKEKNEGLLNKSNIHPCVKPQKLLSYFLKMITPPGGVCIDPFMGSGSTGISAINNGFNFIGIEKEKEYFEIAQARINHAFKHPKEFSSPEAQLELPKDVLKEKVW